MMEIDLHQWRLYCVSMYTLQLVKALSLYVTTLASAQNGSFTRNVGIVLHCAIKCGESLRATIP